MFNIRNLHANLLYYRLAAEEQERRDYELATRLAQVSTEATSSSYCIICM